MSLNIPVILGSVREGRKSIFAAQLIEQKLQEVGIHSQLVDFKNLPLPFVDSSVEPSQLYPTYPYPNVQTWSSVAQAADACVSVAPEYTHGYSGVLKNALDWLYVEFKLKPVGLVGVSSGQVGGARVIEQLRPIMENFSMFAIRETVMFSHVQTVFDEQGKLLDDKYLKSIDSSKLIINPLLGSLS